jgi:hypothetical protein
MMKTRVNVIAPETVPRKRRVLFIFLKPRGLVGDVGYPQRTFFGLRPTEACWEVERNLLH